MKDFCDLPKPVREKIYRMHLVQDDPVKFSEFKAICNCSDENEESSKKPPRIMPSLFQVSRKVEREASPIYLGENVLQIDGWKGFQHWFRRLWPRHAQQIRKIVLAEWGTGSGYPAMPAFGNMYGVGDFKRLKQLRMLQSLVVVVDEKKLLYLQLDKLRYWNKWHDGLELGPRVHLQMMHIQGMAGLRTLRGLRNVEFRHPASDEQQGSIPGGFLETIVKREIMRGATTYNRRGDEPFRFLDLPPEIRNIVYDLLMTKSGATFPDKGRPTSIECLQPSKRSDAAAPHSALDLTCVSRQIHDEADTIFYRQNDLVFPSPVRLQNFISTLGLRRIDALRSLTFVYKGSQLGTPSDGFTLMETTLSTLRLLRGLRKLHILIAAPYYSGPHWSPVPRELNHKECHPACLDGASYLFKFRNLEDLRLFGPHTERKENNISVEAVKGVKRLDAIFRHFNHGLQLAQKGQIFPELYTDKFWAGKGDWPSLGTESSICGLAKGCSCGKSSDDDESK